MIWLAIHMWFLLFCAFAIGVATGWWMRREPAMRPAPQQSADTPLGTLDSDAPDRS